MGWSRVQSQHDVERRRRRHYGMYDDHVVEQPVVEVPTVDLSEHVVKRDDVIQWPSGETGIRTRLKPARPQGHESSTLSSATTDGQAES